MTFGLNPIYDTDTEILILGSMPGVESLKRREYYANNRNVFWRIMSEVYEFDASLPYTERVAFLKKQRVGLWDVLAACDREGSLDSQIKNPKANDLGPVLRGGNIKTILCNGQKAYGLFQRFYPDCKLANVLPSTSAANTKLTFEEKLAEWRRGVVQPISDSSMSKFA